LLRRVVDAVIDCAVVSFALWTLLYCLGLVTQWRLWASGWLWVAATVALLVWQVRLALTAGPELEPGGPGASGPTQAEVGADVRVDRVARVLLGAGLVAAAVAAVGGLLWTPGTFRVTWAATVLASAALLAWSWRVGRTRPAPGVPPPGVDPVATSRSTAGWPLADLGALVLAAAAAVAGLFIHLADTDDPYYVNRSVWVAERGNAALLDTMFSPEVLNSPYGGGVPIASVEALVGVLAHLTGLHAGTVTYLVVTPVGSALAVWAMWRLARRWAPRRAFWVLAAAVAFLMLSGDSMLGNFWVVRMWQGKVLAVTILIPLIWAYLTELVEARTPAERRRALALLLAAGVAFFGMTPTAVVWGPVMFGAVALAALLVRSPLLLVGGAAMVTGPVASGLAVVLFSTDVGGEDPVALPSRASFVRILGEVGPMVALGLLGLCLAAVLARRGVAAALAGSAALVAVFVFAPGVLPLINAVTGSGPILWRMLYVAPIPILVGLLLALPWPTRGDGLGPDRGQRLLRAAGVATAAVLVLGLAVGGRPVWWHTGHGGPVTVSSSPQWKLDLPALDDVRLLDERGWAGADDEVVLLPPRRMKVMTMYTTRAFPVVPRHWFIRNMEEPRQSRQARLLLHDLASGEDPLPSQREVTRALRQLDVALACTGVSPNTERVLGLYEGAGYGDRETVGTLVCVRPEGG
jgi:hypothetical protein